MNSLYKGERRARGRMRAGIRRQIRVGFIVLAALLLFSGMVSWFEFARLNDTTDTLLEISLRDLELSTTMSEAIGRQHEAVVAGTPDAGQLLDAACADFDSAFGEAERLGIYPARLSRIANAKRLYDGLLADTTARGGTAYRIAWYDLALDIKDFMIDSQNTVDRNTNRVQAGAYRAMMPGIITLVIAIVIIVIFCFLIDLYYIAPIIKVNRALENYLDQRVPYRVKLEGRDEVRELSERIETLVSMTVKKETNP